MLLNYIKQGTYTTFFYGINSIIARTVGFIFLPYMLSHLTLEEFGIWDFYQLIFSTGALILSSCTSSSMIRFYILYKDDPLKQRQSLGNALIATIILSVIFPCLLLLFYFFFYENALSQYLFITLINISFFSLFTVFLSYVRVQEKLILYTIFSCTQNFIAIMGTIFGLMKGFALFAFFYANLISYIVFLPFIIVILAKNFYYSLSILKQQIMYSFPLLLYGLIYTGLFSIDKIFIQNHLGYEVLGLYGLLWRFGGIFQMLAIAMIDAWYIMLYNVQKEHESHLIISKLIRYYAIALTTICLVIILGAMVGIKLIFPFKYHYCIQYIPLFFVPLILVEIARLFQTAFGLSTKTIYMPVLTSITIVIQTIFLYFLIPYGIFGVFLANTFAFTGYIFNSYYLSKQTYPHEIIDIKKIIILLTFFIINVCFCYYCFTSNYYIISFGCLFGWPLFLFMSNLTEAREKEWILAKIKSYLPLNLLSLYSFKKLLKIKKDHV